MLLISVSKSEMKLARSFTFTFRYIGDILSLNNYIFGDFIEVEIKDTTDTDTSASYLDLHFEVDVVATVKLLKG
jgi:hypothetical protein